MQNAGGRIEISHASTPVSLRPQRCRGGLWCLGELDATLCLILAMTPNFKKNINIFFL